MRGIGVGPICLKKNMNYIHIPALLYTYIYIYIFFDRPFEMSRGVLAKMDRQLMSG